MVFSPRTALFTNHCLRITPSNQQQFIEIRATFQDRIAVESEGNPTVEMVVSSEPLTDVIDGKTRSMRSCASICDIQKSTDCHCYSAMEDMSMGQSVFIAEESLYRGPSTERFFSILTDFRAIDSLQMTHYEEIMPMDDGLIGRNDFMQHDELEQMMRVGSSALILGIFAGIITRMVRGCKTWTERKMKKK